MRTRRTAITPDSDLERQLWSAYPLGEWIDLCGTADETRLPPPKDADWPITRSVRGELISALLLGAVPSKAGYVPAIRLAGVRITGRIVVSGGSATSLLRLRHCVLDNEPRFTEARTHRIRITDCRLPGFDGMGLITEGYLSLSGCRLDGPLRIAEAQLLGGLRMNGTTVVAADGWAVDMSRTVIEASALCQDLTVEGGLQMAGAHIRGGIFLGGAHLINSAGPALDGANMRVDDIFECGSGPADQTERDRVAAPPRPFTAEGKVSLLGAKVTGMLSFDDAVLTGAATGTGTPDPDDRLALDLRRLTADELTLTMRSVNGLVSITYAKVGILADRPEHWPTEIRLNGLVYDTLIGGVEQRIDWVERDPVGFRPQPYEQLAAWYQQVGHDDLARKTLLAKQRARRRGMSATGRVWNVLLDWTVGYGYRPWLAGVWLALLLTMGTIVFSMDHPQPETTSGHHPFHPLLYAIDVLVPLGVFENRNNFEPVGWTLYFSYVLTAAGWLLATALVAGMARVLKPSGRG